MSIYIETEIKLYAKYIIPEKSYPLFIRPSGSILSDWEAVPGRPLTDYLLSTNCPLSFYVTADTPPTIEFRGDFYTIEGAEACGAELRVLAEEHLEKEQIPCSK